MQWIYVRDMLIFETYEDFFTDLVQKISAKSRSELSIGMNEDLQII